MSEETRKHDSKSEFNLHRLNSKIGLIADFNARYTMFEKLENLDLKVSISSDPTRFQVIT